MKNDIIFTLKKKIKQDGFLVGAGIDSREQLHCCENNECDLILLYPTRSYANKVSNRFLTGYLAFNNTNNMMLDFSKDLQIYTRASSFFAGINGSDPFKNDHLLLEEMKNSGFIGIHNYPSMALVDGSFGANINYLKSGFEKELAFFKKAKSYGFHTCAMIQTTKQAIQMIRSGADILIIYLGLGKKNTDALSQFDHDIHRLNEISTTIRKMSKEIPILFYGEHIKTIREISYIKNNVSGIHGYFLLPIANHDISLKQLEIQIRGIHQL